MEMALVSTICSLIRTVIIFHRNKKLTINKLFKINLQLLLDQNQFQEYRNYLQEG